LDVPDVPDVFMAPAPRWGLYGDFHLACGWPSLAVCAFSTKDLMPFLNPATVLADFTASGKPFQLCTTLIENACLPSKLLTSTMVYNFDSTDAKI
jgi:hypothetical protein